METRLLSREVNSPCTSVRKRTQKIPWDQNIPVNQNINLLKALINNTPTTVTVQKSSGKDLKDDVMVSK